MKKFLLHVCCAPCASTIIQQLKARGFKVTAFFYNPNIYPAQEYKIRRDEIKKYCLSNKIDFIEMEYNHALWREKIKGFEQEPERGERCQICYSDRLNKTAEHSIQKGYDIFDSTLSISPHKDFEKIKSIGENLAEKYDLEYYGQNWKKDQGFKRACELSKEQNFYRQTYCGCEFSML